MGIETCGSAHYWAHEIGRLGHTVKLMPPGYVKAYVKRGKNDASDAEAICEAVQRPSMRFVLVKSAEQQVRRMIYKLDTSGNRHFLSRAAAMRHALQTFQRWVSVPFGSFDVVDTTASVRSVMLWRAEQ